MPPLLGDSRGETVLAWENRAIWGYLSPQLPRNAKVLHIVGSIVDRSPPPGVDNVRSDILGREGHLLARVELGRCSNQEGEAEAASNTEEKQPARPF